MDRSAGFRVNALPLQKHVFLFNQAHFRGCNTFAVCYEPSETSCTMCIWIFIHYRSCVLIHEKEIRNNQTKQSTKFNNKLIIVGMSAIFVFLFS